MTTLEIFLHTAYVLYCCIKSMFEKKINCFRDPLPIISRSCHSHDQVWRLACLKLITSFSAFCIFVSKEKRWWYMDIWKSDLSYVEWRVPVPVMSKAGFSFIIFKIYWALSMYNRGMQHTKSDQITLGSSKFLDTGLKPQKIE